MPSIGQHRLLKGFAQCGRDFSVSDIGGGFAPWLSARPRRRRGGWGPFDLGGRLARAGVSAIGNSEHNYPSGDQREFLLLRELKVFCPWSSFSQRGSFWFQQCGASAPKSNSEKGGKEEGLAAEGAPPPPACGQRRAGGRRAGAITALHSSLGAFADAIHLSFTGPVSKCGSFIADK